MYKVIEVAGLAGIVLILALSIIAILFMAMGITWKDFEL